MSAAKKSGKIVFITAGGPYPAVIANALFEKFSNVTVLQEEPESKALFIKRRAKRFGWIQALGQLGTMVLSKFGKYVAKSEVSSLIETYQLETQLDPELQVLHVSSANSADCLERIATIQPDLVFLSSCRLLSANTIAAIKCPILNFHSGINPGYRGLMGGYWARANNDLENYGTTIHLVDAGIDTGDILYQARVSPTPGTTIFSDAMLQAAISREIAVKAVEDTIEKRFRPQMVDMVSNLWVHPPIWQYLWTGLTRRIW